MSEEQRAGVHRAARSLPKVSVQDFCDDMMSLMAAADVVLAMGGYNTVCELLTLRKRALLVPRVKPGVEQCMRAQRMAALGLVRMLHPQDLSPATLLRGLIAELTALTGRAPLPRLRRLDGLARVTAAIFEAVGLRVAPTPPGAAHTVHRAHDTQEAAWHPQPAPALHP
jgi:predicted glycosyltransferase